MAEVLQPADKPIPTSGGDNGHGLNLVDLAGPTIIDKPIQQKTSTAPPPETVTAPSTLQPSSFHLKPSNTSDGDLTRSYLLKDPGSWDTNALRDIYDKGVFKIIADPDGQSQFGLRVSHQKNDRNEVVPIHKPRLDDKGIALELQFKF